MPDRSARPAFTRLPVFSMYPRAAGGRRRRKTPIAAPNTRGHPGRFSIDGTRETSRTIVPAPKGESCAKAPPRTGLGPVRSSQRPARPEKTCVKASVPARLRGAAGRAWPACPRAYRPSVFIAASIPASVIGIIRSSKISRIIWIDWVWGQYFSGTGLIQT